MPVLMARTYYYSSQVGPNRNGSARAKMAIYPGDTSELSYEDLLSMAEQIVDWGQERYANDHGSTEDHKMLLEFVTATMRMLSL